MAVSLNSRLESNKEEGEEGSHIISGGGARQEVPREKAARNTPACFGDSGVGCRVED